VPVRQHVGAYIKDLDKRDLSISLFSGRLELRDLELRPEGLEALGLPIRVLQGSCAALAAGLRAPRTG
jgi:hypothetical protein